MFLSKRLCKNRQTPYLLSRRLVALARCFPHGFLCTIFFQQFLLCGNILGHCLTPPPLPQAFCQVVLAPLLERGDHGKVDLLPEAKPPPLPLSNLVISSLALMAPAWEERAGGDENTFSVLPQLQLLRSHSDPVVSHDL